ncbi:hypothetical protein HELRODRAFT_161115 [Helobdella robusta]|uniref:Protein inscuteable homologue C-terminal domain-containing protein n=1 Tax=Helobdella robusta TaxID=6412 RepID=T1ER39_HELRO|nr:hypothetical protein HELRODRAFT_161115 [Helobdella robusta]ESO01914.1 hypothetical protein HELRODRAFT_161115 [Helobdella robusta]
MSVEQHVNGLIASFLKENISEPSKQWLLDIRQSVDVECMCVLQAHIMKFQTDSCSLMEKLRTALIRDKYTKKQKILIELVKLETTLGTLHGNIMQILLQTFLNGGFEFLRKLSTFTKNQHLLEKKNATYIKKAKTFFSDLISICLLSDDVTEIIVQEKTVENLLELCHTCSVDIDRHGVIYKNYSGPLRSVLAELLRSLSTICSLVSGVDSFIKSNGYEIMTNLLMNPCSNHRTKIEIAGVVAQASTPTLFICQQMESYIECIPHIIKALIEGASHILIVSKNFQLERDLPSETMHLCS